MIFQALQEEKKSAKIGPLVPEIQGGTRQYFLTSMEVDIPCASIPCASIPCASILAALGCALCASSLFDLWTLLVTTVPNPSASLQPLKFFFHEEKIT